MGPSCPQAPGPAGSGLGASQVPTKDYGATDPAWGQCLEEARRGRGLNKGTHFLQSLPVFLHTSRASSCSRPGQEVPGFGWGGGSGGGGSLDGRQGLWPSLLPCFTSFLLPQARVPPLATNQGTGTGAMGSPGTNMGTSQ